MNSLSPAILIGTSGQVAGALLVSLRARGASVLASSSSAKPGAKHLNLAQPSSIREFFAEAGKQFGPSQSAEVFLPGALTHVDRCEEERDLCKAINEDGPALVAEECAKRGYKLTFFSTEYVFGEAEYQGGAVGPFSETDAPAPTSYYGQCKLNAEKKVLALLGGNALVVRTTMVFSYNPTGNNFLMQYLKQLGEIQAGRKPNIFRIPEDQISTPTYAPWLAECTCVLRERGVGGIVNLVGTDCLSRREIVERVIQRFGFNLEASLPFFQYQKTKEMGQKAKRPLTAGLSSAKAKSLGLSPLSLEEAFALALAEKNRA